MKQNSSVKTTIRNQKRAATGLNLKPYVTVQGQGPTGWRLSVCINVTNSVAAILEQFDPAMKFVYKSSRFVTGTNVHSVRGTHKVVCVLLCIHYWDVMRGCLASDLINIECEKVLMELMRLVRLAKIAELNEQLRNLNTAKTLAEFRDKDDPFNEIEW